MSNNWLYKLIARNNCNYKLNPEALIQFRFADSLRALSLENKLKCIWFSVCNELGGDKKNNHRGAYLQGLGKIAGTADMIFLWETGSGCIEFKSKTGRQTEEQKLFEKWCEAHRVKYRIAKSTEEALNILKEWELISEDKSSWN
jgi:hypothetical protein